MTVTLRCTGEPRDVHGFEAVEHLWDVVGCVAARSKNGRVEQAGQRGMKYVSRSRITVAQQEYGVGMIDVMYLVTQFKVKQEEIQGRTCVVDIKKYRVVSGTYQSPAFATSAIKTNARTSRILKGATSDDGNNVGNALS